MTQLIFGDTQSIDSAYQGKNIVKKRKPILKGKQLSEEDIVKQKKFNEYCKKKGFQKNGVWDYEKLVIKKGRDVINLNLKDVYKLFERNNKLKKTYFIMLGKHKQKKLRNGEILKMNELKKDIII